MDNLEYLTVSIVIIAAEETFAFLPKICKAGTVSTDFWLEGKGSFSRYGEGCILLKLTIFQTLGMLQSFQITFKIELASTTAVSNMF